MEVLLQCRLAAKQVVEGRPAAKVVPPPQSTSLPAPPLQTEQSHQADSESDYRPGFRNFRK